MALEAGTAAFLEGRGAQIVGVVDTDGWPFASRSWGITVLSAEEGRLRVMLDEDEVQAFAHLVRGGAIAITAADVGTLRSGQVKGTLDRIEPVSAADLEVVEAHCHAVFTDISRVDHIGYELAARMKPFRFVALEVTIDEVYDQTPGPGAGAAIGELPE